MIKHTAARVVVGAGNRTCKFLLSRPPRSFWVAEAWVQGFLSGVNNSGTDWSYGKDSTWIFKEVLQIAKDHPDKTIAQAAAFAVLRSQAAAAGVPPGRLVPDFPPTMAPPDEITGDGY